MFSEDFENLSNEKEMSKKEEPAKLIDGPKSDEQEPQEGKGCCSCLFSFKFKKSQKEVNKDLANKEDVKNAPEV